MAQVQALTSSLATSPLRFCVGLSAKPEAGSLVSAALTQAGSHYLLQNLQALQPTCVARVIRWNVDMQSRRVTRQGVHADVVRRLLNEINSSPADAATIEFVARPSSDAHR